MAVFYERFRAEVARYADGVHRLGEPAPRSALQGLPAELADFYASFDGADLFIDAVSIVPAAQVERDGDLVVFGETQTGDRLALDASGQVVRVEVETGETLVEGTGFARWLEGFVVAEGVLYDREGEFRDDIFDDGGEEPTAEVSEKRERRALKIDPDAPAPAWRLARALARLGREDKARATLEKLLAKTPRFGWAWFDLGRLDRAAGKSEEAERAFVAAAQADPSYEHAGYFLAHAARSAAARGDEAARSRHAARALEMDASLARGQKEAAAQLLEDDRRDEALEAAEIAAALAPRDVGALDLLRRLR